MAAPSQHEIKTAQSKLVSKLVGIPAGGKENTHHVPLKKGHTHHLVPLKKRNLGMKRKMPLQLKH